MDGGETLSLTKTLDEANRQLAKVELAAKEIVANKSNHSNKTMTFIKRRN